MRRTLGFTVQSGTAGCRDRQCSGALLGARTDRQCSGTMLGTGTDIAVGNVGYRDRQCSGALLGAGTDSAVGHCWVQGQTVQWGIAGCMDRQTVQWGNVGYRDRQCRGALLGAGVSRTGSPAFTVGPGRRCAVRIAGMPKCL